MLHSREIYTLPGASPEKPIIENVERFQGVMTPRMGIIDDPSGVANGRTRVAGARFMGGTGRAGIVPRLVQHLNNSSLDLTGSPGAPASHRDLSEPRQHPV